MRRGFHFEVKRGFSTLIVGGFHIRPRKNDVTSHPDTSSVNLRLTPSPEGKAREKAPVRVLFLHYYLYLATIAFIASILFSIS